MLEFPGRPFGGGGDPTFVSQVLTAAGGMIDALLFVALSHRVLTTPGHLHDFGFSVVVLASKLMLQGNV